MSNNELDKLNHTLSAINEIGAKTDDLLEKKKNEQTMAVGGTVAARELRDIHEKFMAKSKETLIEEVKAGKVPEAVGNYVMSWLRQSEGVIKKFIVDKTTQMNSKAGEVIATETSIKMLKAFYDGYNIKKTQEQEKIKYEEERIKHEEEQERIRQSEEAKKAEEQPQEPLPPISFADLIPENISSPQTKKGRPPRPRPDEVGPLSKTVKRIKENRRSRAKV